MKKTLKTPEICDIVEYGLNSFKTSAQTWRVKGYMKKKPISKQCFFKTSSEYITYEIINEINQNEKTNKSSLNKDNMIFCSKEEATHLILTSICGTIAPINKCKIIGKVDWDENLINQEKKSYNISLERKIKEF